MTERLVVIVTALLVIAAATVLGPRLGLVLVVIGLTAEQVGALPLAARLPHTAATDPANELPLYRAHQWADHAAVAAGGGDTTAADRSRREAYDLYRRLGASPYVERLEALLALAVTGLSYAQIARAVFVSQSAVGFHVSKLYANFDEGSRHELTALVRGGR